MRTVAHGGVAGLAQFRGENGFGLDGDIEGAAATNVSNGEKLENRECSTGTEGSSTDREGDFC